MAFEDVKEEAGLATFIQLRPSRDEITAAFQTRMVLSQDPVKRARHEEDPSVGWITETATDVTGPRCPLNNRLVSPD